jgi:adenylate cyclase class IV
VELEASAGDDDLDDARAAIGALAEHLGLGQTERRSYLELLLEASDGGQSD